MVEMCKDENLENFDQEVEENWNLAEEMGVNRRAEEVIEERPRRHRGHEPLPQPDADPRPPCHMSRWMSPRASTAEDLSAPRPHGRRSQRLSDVGLVRNVGTPIHDSIRELVTWECKEHGVKSVLANPKGSVGCWNVNFWRLEHF